MRVIHWFYVTLFTCFLLLGCREDAPESIDDTVTIAISKEVTRIHPIVHPSSVAREVYQYIFLPLADVDPETYEITPLLIKELATVGVRDSGRHKGSTTYSMEIIDKAAWDDGRPITGHDYAFTMKSIKHPSTDAALYRSATSSVIDVEVDPDNPKRFVVIVDDVDLLTEEIVETMYVYPRHIYDPRGVLDSVTIPDLMDGDRYSVLQDRHPSLDSFALDFNGLRYGREVVSGSGPYRLVSWSDDNRILLERKDSYWAEASDVFAFKAEPRYIEITTIPDPATILTLLKSGSVDVSNALTPAYFNSLQNDSILRDKYRFLTPELTKFYGIALNNVSPKLRSSKVRTALAHMTDVKTLMQVLENGLGTQTTGIFHPRKSYYKKKEPLSYDVQKAIVLLEEEGWVDSDGDGIRDRMVDGIHTELSLDLYITGSAFSKSIAVLLKEDYAKAGVDVQLITKPYADIRREHLRKRSYDMTVLAFPQSITLDDPYIKWHSDNDTPTGGNFVSYRSVEADRLIARIRDHEDPDHLSTYYHKLQDVMYRDMPILFLYNPIERIVVNRQWKAQGTSRRPGYLANTFQPAKK